MSKQYALEIENVGEDVYMLMSRGHHDPHEFMRKVRAEGWTWPLGMPTHEWMKVTPTRIDGLRCMYSIVTQGTRGAIPVTYAREAWNEDAYEAITRAAAAIGAQHSQAGEG